MATPTTSLADLAREISRRILAGEKVPAEELASFILAAHSEIKGERKKKEAGEKDVDFF